MCCFQLKKLLKQNCKYVPCEQLQSYIDKVQAAGRCSTESNCVDLRNFVGLLVAPGFQGHCEIVATTQTTNAVAAAAAATLVCVCSCVCGALQCIEE
jgi:hypothetical protein